MTRVRALLVAVRRLIHLGGSTDCSPEATHPDAKSPFREWRSAFGPPEPATVSSVCWPRPHLPCFSTRLPPQDRARFGTQITYARTFPHVQMVEKYARNWLRSGVH